jgi:uncharacterized membrane protein
MVEPVALENFFITFFAGAAVILCGALYALLFAWARVRHDTRFLPWAYMSYAGLTLAVFTLAQTTHLFNSPFWTLVVALMLVGYLLAPHGIWHLCVGTHVHEDSTS